MPHIGKSVSTVEVGLAAEEKSFELGLRRRGDYSRNDGAYDINSAVDRFRVGGSKDALQL